jgi:hypothetical protein
VDTVGAVLEQGVAEVDEGEFGEAEHRGDPPVGLVHPGGGPAEFVAEPEQGSPVLRIEPDPQRSPPGRESGLILERPAVPGDSERGVTVGALLRLGRTGVERPVDVQEQQWSVHDPPVLIGVG